MATRVAATCLRVSPWADEFREAYLRLRKAELSESDYKARDSIPPPIIISRKRGF